ncbi:hypothetical protein PUN28_000605 [Cardiocondyla obscurior]|uniref:Uncharacterized protein n=1 Tax=Cardiocondyla obscurior TaxID=286306 RepID=A0AAW2H0S7_9HYME
MSTAGLAVCITRACLVREREREIERKRKKGGRKREKGTAPWPRRKIFNWMRRGRVERFGYASSRSYRAPGRDDAINYPRLSFVHYAVPRRKAICNHENCVGSRTGTARSSAVYLLSLESDIKLPIIKQTIRCIKRCSYIQTRKKIIQFIISGIIFFSFLKNRTEIIYRINVKTNRASRPYCHTFFVFPKFIASSLAVLNDKTCLSVENRHRSKNTACNGERYLSEFVVVTIAAKHSRIRYEATGGGKLEKRRVTAMDTARLKGIKTGPAEIDSCGRTLLAVITPALYTRVSGNFSMEPAINTSPRRQYCAEIAFLLQIDILRSVSQAHSLMLISQEPILEITLQGFVRERAQSRGLCSKMRSETVIRLAIEMLIRKMPMISLECLHGDLGWRLSRCEARLECERGSRGRNALQRYPCESASVHSNVRTACR